MHVDFNCAGTHRGLLDVRFFAFLACVLCLVFGSPYIYYEYLIYIICIAFVPSLSFSSPSELVLCF